MLSAMEIFCLFFVLIFAKNEKLIFRNIEIIDKIRKVNFPIFDNIIKSINFDIYQTMLITDENEKKLLKNIQENLPVLQMNTTQFKGETIDDFKTLKNIRDTTLFLIIDKSRDEKNFTKIEKLMIQIGNLVGHRIRPRCLILRFLDTKNILNNEGFLQKMWNDLFLDVTIIDISKKRATIHQLNPFVSYNKGKFTKTSFLFPDKLRNMNGFPMKIGIFQSPPLVYVKRNSTHHPIRTFGKDAFIGELFSQSMKFYPSMVPSKKEVFGTFSTNKNKTTGFFNQLLHRKLQYIGTSVIMFNNHQNGMKQFQICEFAFFDYEYLVAVVPKLIENSRMFISKSAFYTIPLLMSIIMISWSLEHLFDFNKKIWNHTTIIHILLGVSVPEQPKKQQERIIFLTMVLGSFFFSSKIFAALTDVNIRNDGMFKINSFMDLNKSSLEIGFLKNIMYFIQSTQDKDLIEIVMKKRRVFTSDELCLKNLIEKKNVACIMKRTVAEWYLLKYKNKENEVMSLIPDNFYTTIQGFILEPGSPYGQKFQEIFHLLRQCGLLNQWKIKLTDYMRNEMKTLDLEHIEENEKVHFKMIIIAVISFGLGVSFLVFLCELLIDKINKVFF